MQCISKSEHTDITVAFII